MTKNIGFVSEELKIFSTLSTLFRDIAVGFEFVREAGEINRLTPNDPYMGRITPLTSKRCILYIYSTNIGTEYFKHAVYSPFFLFKM